MPSNRIVNVADLPTFTAINVLSDPGHIPGPIVIPNCLQIRLLWLQIDGKQAVNVLHARMIPPFTPTATVATNIHATLGASLGSRGVFAFQPPASELVNVDLRDLSSVDNPLIPGTGNPFAGSSTGTAMPNEVAIVLSARTAKTGQANRGRIYIPNWSANAMGTGGRIAAALVTALGGFGTDLMNAINGVGGLVMALAHPARAAYTGKAGTLHPARPPGTVDVVQVFMKNDTFDSMRRRGLK